MKKNPIYLFLCAIIPFFYCSADPTLLDPQETRPIVLQTKRLYFREFSNAFNPSLLKIEEGYLLIFRETPEPHNRYWISQIYIVQLDNHFLPISEPQLLNTRSADSSTPSQAEDARLFYYQDKIYLIYNDATENINPTSYQRRDIYLAELAYQNKEFTLTPPLRLVYEEKRSIPCQKNWAPFQWDRYLLLSYSISPHEILLPHLKSGECHPLFNTTTPHGWDLGTLRGGTPALLDEDEYLAFFHSGKYMSSWSTWQRDAWHYFMGAYTFSKDPPFTITKISKKPIVGAGFYTLSAAPKRVIFPMSFTIDGPYIHLAYGKDDCEIWIATLDKQALKDSLIPLEQ